ncbi:AI-2E family transporter [Candidatus Tiddalikarchaeum anstoanum]|nr:AI-2E family transporter [Candidatus Tiddalikarchaeum anstoanum]
MAINAKLLLIIGVIVLFLSLLYLSIPFYQIIALSFIIAYFMQPLKNYFVSKFKDETLASVLCVIIGFSVLSTIIYILINFLLKSLQGISSFANDAATLNTLNEVLSRFQAYNIQEPLTRTGINKIVTFVQNIVFSTPQIIIQFVVLMFFLFYLIKYNEEFIDFIRRFIPVNELSFFNRLIKRVNEMMRAIFYSQFITAFIQSVILFIFLLIIKIPYSFELSLFTFFMCFFSITVLVVPVGVNIFYLVTSNYPMLVVSLVFTALISTIDNFIKPMVGEKIARMNPIFFMIGLVAGAFTLGFTGFFIGPMLFGVFQAGLEIIYEKKKLNFA